jgi:uncharacterized protein Yka (UPF0111/DUF47 family)
MRRLMMKLKEYIEEINSIFNELDDLHNQLVDTGNDFRKILKRLENVPSEIDEIEIEKEEE